MSRLPAPDLATMTDAQRAVHDSIAGGARGSVRGPFLTLLNNPDLASRVQQLGAYVRYGCAVPQALRELAIITVARFWRADYEWHAHASIALSQGIASDIVDAIGRGDEPAFGDEAQAVVHGFARELLETRRVGDATFARARDLLGQAGVLDLAGLVGYYSLLALVINATEVDVPVDADIPWRR